MAKVIENLVVDIEPGKALRALAEANQTMDAMLEKIGEQALDIAFLAERASRSGSFYLSGERDTGVSSNSIVAIAYGLIPLEKQELPFDSDDLSACCRMLDKLPKHRLSMDVHEAMFRATQHVSGKAAAHA